MIAYHCDVDGCDTWQRLDSENPVFHVLVSANEDQQAQQLHFCSMNCVMIYAAAHSSPTESHQMP